MDGLNHASLTPRAIRQPLSFVDVFAGCGGLSLGLMQAGWRGLFAIEHEPNAFATLAANLLNPHTIPSFAWPEWLPQKPVAIEAFLKNYQTQIEGLAGRVDMLVGGPPCQGYSSAGRRKTGDPRNRLFESYLDVVEVLQPKVVLIENVRGITHDFAAPEDADATINYSRRLIERLSATYHTQSKILDASDFGVPQRRMRFFVVAVRKNAMPSGMPDIFGELERDRHSFLRSKRIVAVPVSSASAISDLELGRNQKRASCETKGFEELVYGGALTAFQRLMNASHSGELTDTRLARHRPEITKRFSEIIKLCRLSGRLNVSLSSELRAAYGLRKCAIRVLDPDAPAPTITSMPDDLIHYLEPRALTVRENARLQSFPDWFAFKGKYTTGGERRRVEVPRFTQVANAVPPLLAEAIGYTIARVIADLTAAAERRPQQEPRTAPDARAA